MTNYNERLDEILYDYWARHRGCEEGCQSPDGGEITKQSITSLFKELVADAKPAKKPQFFCQGCDKSEERGYNQAIKEFEQNLLKALEEV